MGQRFFPFLVLLTFYSCFGNTINIDQMLSTETQYSGKSTKLIDLNADCLYLIFDRLDLADLLSIADVNSYFNNIATDLFRQKYSGYEFEILDNQRSYIVRAPPKYMALYDFELFSNLMKNFGKQVRKITIRNQQRLDYTSGSKWATVNRMVNEYGSKSLTELNLGEVGKMLWPQFTVPFEKVEKLELKIQTDTDGMKLNELCPALKELHIKLENDVNYEFIDCQMPYLKHLEIIYHGWIENRKEQIIGMIEKNPQIRSVIADLATFKFNEVISEYLRELDYLSIKFNDNLNDPLHFGNVDHCVLDTWDRTTIRKLSFSHLNSLEIKYSNEELNKYIEFFQRHQNLSRLYLLRDSGDALRLEELTAELSNLEMMIVSYYSGVNMENVIGFIESHPKLVIFEFPVHEIDEADRAVLREKFEKDWHIWSIVNRQDAFVFEKKMKL